MSSSRKDVSVDWEHPVAIGSTCSIYKGLFNGEEIAVKSVKPRQAYSFHDEKAMLDKLNELDAPNTIRYLDNIPCSLDDNHVYCLSLEWMPESLFAAFTHEEIDWKDRYELMLQMLNAVAFYHAHSILHRDIKSLNVLMDEKHDIKFCDFAMARELKDGEACKEAGASLQWASPEYLANKPVTYASDIYSLATTFWEVVQWNGDIPFGADYPNIAEMKKAILAGERNGIPKTCPAPIAKLITWGWAQDPEERPTAEELLSEFKKVYVDLF